MSNWIFHLALWIFAQLSYPFLALWWLGIVLAGGDRRRHIALAVDQLWNTPWGGHEDETISSRAEKARLRGDRWGCVLCKWLDKVDPGHCQRALEKGEGKPVPAGKP